MNRNQAMLPVIQGEARFTLNAGRIFRSQILRLALKHNIQYYEDKGLLDSFFIFRGATIDATAFKKAVDNLEKL